MTAEETLNVVFNYERHKMADMLFNDTHEAVVDAMKEYSKMKCKELLLMTAEKAIGREGLTAYDILAVDLNEFIK